MSLPGSSQHLESATICSPDNSEKTRGFSRHTSNSFSPPMGISTSAKYKFCGESALETVLCPVLRDKLHPLISQP